MVARARARLRRQQSRPAKRQLGKKSLQAAMLHVTEPAAQAQANIVFIAQGIETQPLSTCRVIENKNCPCPLEAP